MQAIFECGEGPQWGKYHRSFIRILGTKIQGTSFSQSTLSGDPFSADKIGLSYLPLYFILVIYG